MDLRTYYVQLLRDDGRVTELETRSEDYKTAAELIASQYTGSVLGIAAAVADTDCSCTHRLCVPPTHPHICKATTKDERGLAWGCSREANHLGPHIACGLIGHSYVHWE